MGSLMRSFVSLLFDTCVCMCENRLCQSLEFQQYGALSLLLLTRRSCARMMNNAGCWERCGGHTSQSDTGAIYWPPVIKRCRLTTTRTDRHGSQDVSVIRPRTVDRQQEIKTTHGRHSFIQPQPTVQQSFVVLVNSPACKDHSFTSSAYIMPNNNQ